MTQRPCNDFTIARSAYVDGELSDREQQSLLRHLVGCPACRVDVDELRRLQGRLVQFGDHPTDASAELLDRLASFPETVNNASRRGARLHGVLPRRHDQHRDGRLVHPKAFRVTITGAVVLLTLIAGVGYVSAPSWTSAAQAPYADFAVALAQAQERLPNESLAAVAMTDQEALTRHHLASPRLPAASGKTLTRTQISELLRRVQQATSTVAHRGRVVVGTPRDNGGVEAIADIRHDSGRGSRVDVHRTRADGSAGKRENSVTLPTQPVTHRGGTDLAAALSGRYTLRGRSGGSWLGRQVSRIEATRPDRTRSDHPAARWWIDDRSGLVLARQTFDHTGRLVMYTRYQRLHIGQHATGEASSDKSSSAGRASDRRASDSPQLSVRRSAPLMPDTSQHMLAPKTVSSVRTSAADLGDRGWACHSRLAGLQLVDLHTDRSTRPKKSTGPKKVHLTYTDGLSTVSVFEQRGRRPHHRATKWDPSIHAYRKDSAANVATWQSGGTAFTVITDGSAALRNRVIAALPHRGVSHRSPIERVSAGWSKIADRILG